MIKIKIKEQSFFARLAGYIIKSESAAIVFGKTIHLWNVSRKNFLKNERWLQHELEHIRQYKQEGLILFIFKYVIESLKHGYYNNRFEVEARNAEKNMGLYDEFLYS